MSNFNYDMPVFIVSSGRSGTTLLRSMLNAGNELHIPHESDFIARAFPVFGEQVDFQESNYDMAISYFKRTSQNVGWGLSSEYLMEFLKKKLPKTFKELNTTFVQAYLAFHKLNPKKWGIKAPVLIASIDRILAVYPSAKIVHLVRDGRDVFLSYRTVHQNPNIKSFGPNGVVASALYWIDGLRRVQEFENNIYELRYEDLLSSPEKELKRVSAFLEISYDVVMHSSFAKAEVNKDAILQEHKTTIHAKIANGLDASNTRKYLSKMTKTERFVFELFASPYLKKYGYELEFPLLNYTVISPFRGISYAFARIFNDYRYSHRDKITCLNARKMLNEM